MVTQEQVRELFSYSDGALYRRRTTSPRAKAGDEVGWMDGHGYKMVSIGPHRYPVHRLVYLYHTGEYAPYIDHINNDPLDNHIENLRPCGHSENMRNARMKRNNTSGFKGVSLNKRRGTWVVRVMVNGKYKHFGEFDDVEFAGLVADEVRNRYHKEFANHG